ncbi:TlpA disulfide reductase family protein [Desulfogranum japonicum]|uniref:TlpA disulfide reductase family protein n=1 Tax=Desulfogranum japonicum TaxID=231447 RepID=UPI00048D0A02|nr:TlpA disulfide reductase family protein [Desulfogranum japonicum]
MVRNVKYLVLSLFMVIVFTACIRSPVSAGVTMPSFTLSSVSEGKTVRSADFAGKAMLITFFATWCTPCRMEIPVLKSVHGEYASQGFTVVGLSVDESGADVVARLVEQEQIPYPVLMADKATASKFGGVAAIPTSFLVNKKGEVVKTYPGYIPIGLLKKDIKSVL